MTTNQKASHLYHHYACIVEALANKREVWLIATHARCVSCRVM